MTSDIIWYAGVFCLLLVAMYSPIHYLLKELRTAREALRAADTREKRLRQLLLAKHSCAAEPEEAAGGSPTTAEILNARGSRYAAEKQKLRERAHALWGDPTLDVPGVSKCTGVGMSTLARWAKEGGWGLKVRTTQSGIPTNALDLNLIRDMWYDKSRTIKEICKLFGFTYGSLRHLAKVNGWAAARPVEHRKARLSIKKHKGGVR